MSFKLGVVSELLLLLLGFSPGLLFIILCLLNLLIFALIFAVELRFLKSVSCYRNRLDLDCRVTILINVLFFVVDNVKLRLVRDAAPFFVVFFFFRI